jgi:serine protease DegQ
LRAAIVTPFFMRRLWLIFSQAVTVALALLFVVATLKPEWLQRSPGRMLPQIVSISAVPDGGGVPQAAPGSAAASSSFGSLAAAAQRAAPAVVSIAASKAAANNPHADDPWFRFFFGLGNGPQSPQPQRGLGSGVIVSPEGFLITNHHVVEGADEIEVLLADGRSAQAKLVGSDPETDVAVLRIDLPKLPAIVFGNSNRLQVGEAVLAIGNPFGVGQTVTSGIVSALDRKGLGLNVFENFIQTDAAINPGNSGGALVDAGGNLVGINTAIFSRTGGSLGIGFAIPAATARQVMENLVKDGRVVRGWIGVEPRDLTPDMAETLRLPVKSGVLITGVLRDGPAGAGGLQPGDVVVRIGERAVGNTAELLNAVAALPPGSNAAIGVQRGDKALEVAVKVAQRPPRQQAAR